MHWSNKYVGIPWQTRGRAHDGADCWGLVRLIYREVLSVEIDCLIDRYTPAMKAHDIAGLVSVAAASGQWVKIASEDHAQFDVAVFSLGGLDNHVGVITGPGMMIHAQAGQLSSIARLDSGVWSPRLSGIYRHITRAA